MDFRLGDEIARLKATPRVLDTRKGYVKEYYKIERGPSFVIRPDERVLVCTLEKISMPTDLMGFVELRSTYARLGLILSPTIIDANFSGQLTLEVLEGSFPVKVYAGDRFCHVIFVGLTSPVERPYIGKYQRQQGVTLPVLTRRREGKRL